MRSDRVSALRRLANASFRAKVGRFLVEGPQGVREAVRWHPEALDEVFVADDDPRTDDLATAARDAGIRVTPVPEQVLVAMTETVHPQGVAAVSAFIDVPIMDALGDARLAVLLHEIRDPGNAGTVLRTADAAGADGVVFSGSSVDAYNGKCVRSTAGSLFHVPFATDVDTMVAIEAARTAGMRVLATSGAGGVLLDDVDLSPPTMWVFGNEAHGLPAEVLAAADETVTIPIYGRAESLNLAGAAAVCLYTSARSQRS